MIQFVFPKDSRFMKLLLYLPCAVCMTLVVIFFSSSQIVYAANPNDSVPVTDSQVVLTATVVGGTAQASDWTFTVEGIDGEIANSTEITLRRNQRNNYPEREVSKGRIKTKYFSKPGKRSKRCSRRAMSLGARRTPFG